VRFEGGEFPGAGLTVIARNDASRQSVSVRTDAQWEFELAPLPGPQLIRVTRLPAGWSLKAVTTGGRDITNYGMDLANGVSDLEIVVSSAMSTLRGAVQVTEGELPADAAIVIFADDPNEWRPAATTMRRVWPSADGHFVVEGLAPGRYNVIAVDHTPSYLEENPAAFLSSIRGRSTPVTLGDRETVEIALTLRGVRQ
jgi:hypothetical protein